MLVLDRLLQQLVSRHALPEFKREVYLTVVRGLVERAVHAGTGDTGCAVELEGFISVGTGTPEAGADFVVRNQSRRVNKVRYGTDPNRPP